MDSCRPMPFSASGCFFERAHFAQCRRRRRPHFQGKECSFPYSSLTVARSSAKRSLNRHLAPETPKDPVQTETPEIASWAATLRVDDEYGNVVGNRITTRHRGRSPDSTVRQSKPPAGPKGHTVSQQMFAQGVQNPVRFSHLTFVLNSIACFERRRAANILQTVPFSQAKRKSGCSAVRLMAIPGGGIRSKVQNRHARGPKALRVRRNSRGSVVGVRVQFGYRRQNFLISRAKHTRGRSQLACCTTRGFLDNTNYGEAAHTASCLRQESAVATISSASLLWISYTLSVSKKT
jgi:hypothetical protein